MNRTFGRSYGTTCYHNVVLCVFIFSCCSSVLLLRSIFSILLILNMLFQESLGDVVFAQLPDSGTKIEKNGKHFIER